MKAYTMSLYTIYTYNPYTILCGVYAIYYLVMYCLWEMLYAWDTTRIFNILEMKSAYWFSR